MFTCCIVLKIQNQSASQTSKYFKISGFQANFDVGSIINQCALPFVSRLTVLPFVFAVSIRQNFLFQTIGNRLARGLCHLPSPKTAPQKVAKEKLTHIL
jgi:hypothetical protein